MNVNLFGESIRRHPLAGCLQLGICLFEPFGKRTFRSLSRTRSPTQKPVSRDEVDCCQPGKLCCCDREVLCFQIRPGAFQALLSVCQLARFTPTRCGRWSLAAT